MATRTGPDTQALHDAVEVVASFVSSFEPERYTGVDAASLVTVFARAERLVVTGKTLAATRAASCHPHLATGHRTPAEWLAATTGDSMGDALSLLKLGDALSDQPGVDGALREGKLTTRRARLVSDAVTVNPGAEDRLVERAGTESIRRLRAECLRAKSEGRSREDEARHHQSLHHNRRCRTYTDGEGALRLEAALAPVAGAELLAALDTQVDRIFEAARRSGDHESPDAYRADALVALVTGRGILGPSRRQARAGTTGSGSTGSGSTGSTHSTGSDSTGCRGPGSRASVTITADLTALRRGSVGPGEVCEIQGLGPVPVDEAIATMGRALCHLVITDGVDVTTVCRLGRNIPTPLVLALLERDRTCVVPGCDVTTGLEFDHWQVDYAQGGTISMDNLARLCHHHHQLKTHRGWRLLGGPGNWQFVAPATPGPPRGRRRPERARPTARPPDHPDPPLFTDRE